MALMNFKSTVLKNLFSKPVTRNYPAEPAVYPERSRGHVEITIEDCILCGLCAMNCPSRAHLCMKCSLGSSDFLEEISSLSHSTVFLYFFALITEELIFPFVLCFSCLFFSQLFVRPPPDSHFAFLHFFSMGMVLIPVFYTMS